MFLIDDILLSPAKGMLYIFKQIQKNAEEEIANEEDISGQLSELYMMLETGRITEEEFDNRESILLDKLDQLEQDEEENEDDDGEDEKDDQ